MKPRVKQKLDQIFSYPFFESVGKPLPTTVSSVKTWTQAAKSCGFLKWRNNQLMARNALKGKIQSRYPEDRVNHSFWHRFQEWNPLVDELRPPIIEPFVETLLAKVPLENKSLETVRNAVRSDLMLICLETHYQDIVNPFFFIPNLDPWYASGHFPCGWDGDEFAHDFETGDETIFFDGWDNLSSHGKLIVF
jgi:hypothetical protein